MFIIIIIFSIIFIIVNLLMLLSLILSKKKFFSREKISPFECGFHPYSMIRIPFSLHFFLITIIFLIFDVEIVLFLPMIMIIDFINIYLWYFLGLYFILILLIGLYHEWNQNMLNWTI